MTEQVENPLRIVHTEGTAAETWTVDTNKQLPFDGRALSVDGFQVLGRLRNGNNVVKFSTGYADTQIGPDRDQFQFTWEEPLRGTISATVRMDL